MNMRRADKTLIVLAVCLLALSCATGCKVAPGNDAVLVDAEKSQAISLDVVDALWKVDDANRETMRTQLPKVHDFVEKSRRDFPPAYRAADDAIAVYRAARTAGNQSLLAVALEKVEAIAAEARRYLADAKAKGITRKAS